MYNAKTTRIELRQIIDRLNAANAALRERVSLLEGDAARLNSTGGGPSTPPWDCDPSPVAAAPAAPHWDRGPRPAAPAPAPRDTSFAARAETMRKVGAHLATRLGRPATRDEVLAEVARLAA